VADGARTILRQANRVAIVLARAGVKRNEITADGNALLT
jgi:hypothetical protein